MAKVLPFDNAVINGQTIASSEFVFGSGSIQARPQEISVTTADGKVHNATLSEVYAASFDMWGDVRDDIRVTTPSVGVTCTLKKAATTVLTGFATYGVRYNQAQNTSTITLQFDPKRFQ